MFIHRYAQMSHGFVYVFIYLGLNWSSSNYEKYHLIDNAHNYGLAIHVMKMKIILKKYGNSCKLLLNSSV